MMLKIKNKVIPAVLIGLVLTGCDLSLGGNVGGIADGQEGSQSRINEKSSGEEYLTVVLTEVFGEVLARQMDEDEFKTAEVGYTLMLNGQAKTMKDGRARIDFPDETIVRVGPNTLFTLEAVEGEEENLFKRLFLETGIIWMVLNGGEMEIDTKSGVASVRGSYMSVWYNDLTGELSMNCFEGICGFEENGRKLVIGAGETIVILGIEESPNKGYMSQEDIGVWLEQFPDAVMVADQIQGLIGDFVWEDTNGNGLQDIGEPGLAEAAVSMLSKDGEYLDSTLTDAEGFYTFEGIVAGEYSLVFQKPEGYGLTPGDEGEDERIDSDTDEDGYTATFTLNPGEHREDIDAGMVKIPICPLTGLPIEDESLLDLRPLLLSMSKFPARVRPLGGLTFAPVVFETVLHDGETRLQPLMYCGYPEVQDEEADNNEDYDLFAFRSVRIFYAELAKIFGAGLIYAGGSDEIIGEVLPYTCGFANRKPGDIGGAGLDESQLVEIAQSCQLERGNTDLAVWQFGPPPAGGEPTEKFLMFYNYLNQTRWIYEPEVEGYVRYQNTPDTPNEFTLSTDRLNGLPVVRQNVLVLITEHTVLNEAGTIIEFRLTNHGGYGHLFRDGVRHKICWSTISGDYPTPSSRYRPFQILDCSTKEPINLAYGTTWVNVVDVTTGFAWKGEYWRAWHVQPTYQAP